MNLMKMASNDPFNRTNAYGSLLGEKKSAHNSDFFSIKIVRNKL